MSNYTVAVMQAAGIQPATMLTDLTSGYQMLDYTIDGSKKAIATADTYEIWTFPALTAVNIKAAAITVVKAGTASGAPAVQLVATSVTGLTAWDSAATDGTQLIKFATVGSTTFIVNTTATVIRMLQSTAGLGAGVLRVRIWLEYYVAPPA